MLWGARSQTVPGVIREVCSVQSCFCVEMAVGSVFHDITGLLSTCQVLRVTGLWNFRAGRHLRRSTPLNFGGS